MITAFHFRAEVENPGRNYAREIQELFFEGLLALPGDEIHLEILTGALIVDHVETVKRSLFGFDPRRWNTISRDDFAQALAKDVIYVVAAEGSLRRQRDLFDANLRRHKSYLGGLEVNVSDPVQWATYRGRLIPKCRFFDREVRIFYPKFEETDGADVRDRGLFDVLRRLPFRNVGWEDTGVRYTIFDPFQSFEHTKRVAELEDLLSGHLSRLADEMLLRAATLAPGLRDPLYAVFKTAESIKTAEEIAQVSLSCRRFLEGLADALYPPRDGHVNGRSVGPAAYRNRLWAYVEDHLPAGDGRALVLTQLQDIGNRLDRLDGLANKGLHDRILRSDLRRLILGIVILAYDVFSLVPPPTEAPLNPYSETIDDFARGVIQHYHKASKRDDEVSGEPEPPSCG